MSDQAKDWVIRKRGYFYGPNWSGYTAHVNAAGRYTEKEAKAEASIEPHCMSAHRADEFANAEQDLSASHERLIKWAALAAIAIPVGGAFSEAEHAELIEDLKRARELAG